MNLNFLSYLIPYIVSCGITFGVANYVWTKRQNVVSSLAFVVLMLTEGFWTLFYIGELSSIDLSSKIFWDSLQWVPFVLIPIFALQFSLSFSGRSLSKRSWMALGLPPVLFMILVITDALSLHHLIYQNPVLIDGEPFSALYYDFSYPHWGIMAYVYGVMGAGLFIIGRWLFKSDGIYRSQLAIVLLGLLVPVVGSSASFFLDIRLLGQRDSTPLTFAIGNILVAWGLLRYLLFDLVPIARDLLLENITEAVIVIDLQDRVVDLNPTAREAAALTLKRPDYLGLPIKQIIPDWYETISRHRVLDFVRTEMTTRRESNWQHVDLMLSPLRTRNGSVLGRLIVGRDMTAQVRLREELQHKFEELAAATQRYDELVNSIPGMVYIFGQRPDETLFFEYVSEKCREFNRVEPSDVYLDSYLLLGQFMPEYLPGFIARQNQSARELSLFDVEMPKEIDGQFHWRQYISLPRRLEDGTVIWHGVELDITERKKAEQQARELEMERGRVEILSDFITNASHEFRTPLSIINTSLYILGKSISDDPLKNRLQVIQNQANNILKLVESLVTMTELDSSPKFLYFPTNINEVLREVVIQMQPKLDTHRLVIKLELQDEDMPKIPCDSGRLAQAIGELLENACNFTPEGGTITLGSFHRDHEIVIEIRDTGIGISGEQRNRIFERFYRAEAARTNSGFGLGLPIAQKIIELHNGRIEVESEPRRGSTFRVILPRG